MAKMPNRPHIRPVHPLKMCQSLEKKEEAFAMKEAWETPKAAQRGTELWTRTHEAIPPYSESPMVL